MHTEVHVHGLVPLKGGVTQTEVEQALRPWLEYVDLDGLADARSANQDEPGIVFDRRRRVLDICWTGWVGRNFQRALESALSAVCEFAEGAAAIEVTYYQEDGRDEFGVVFVGPDPTAIERAKRGRLIEDVAMLLSRQFGEQEVGQVATLIERLFEEQARSQQDPASAPAAIRGPISGRKHLH